MKNIKPLLFTATVLLFMCGCRMAGLNRQVKGLYEVNFHSYCDTAQHLLLTEQQFLFFPKEILACSHLTSLHLHMNRFLGLPEEISRLQYLEELSITNSRFKTLPKSISQLKHLKSLWLLDNNISRLPDEIGQLDSLVELNLNGNPISELPESIYRLKNLRKLYVGQWNGSVKLRQSQLDSLKLLLPDCVVKY